MSNNLRILVTGVGGPTPASIVSSLRNFSRFSESWIFGVDANPLATGLYRPELFNKTAVIPIAADPNYWPVIEDLVAEHEIDLALVQPEVEVLEWSKRQSETALPCKAYLPSIAIAKMLVDKTVMSDVLADTGLVPKFIALERNLGNLGSVEDVLTYPFWIRAATGSSGLGSLLVVDSRALESWVLINGEVESFLCSEFLPGRNLACKLLYFEGKLIRSACAERVNYIMSKVAPSGITGNTSFGRFLNETRPIERAAEALDILFEQSGSPKHGFFTADFKEDSNGVALITEINVRNVAFNGCFAELGANFSEDIVRILQTDDSLDMTYRQYQFDDDYVFIRDVDVEPKVIRSADLLRVRPKC